MKTISNLHEIVGGNKHDIKSIPQLLAALVENTEEDGMADDLFRLAQHPHIKALREDPVFSDAMNNGFLHRCIALAQRVDPALYPKILWMVEKYSRLFA